MMKLSPEKQFWLLVAVSAALNGIAWVIAVVFPRDHVAAVLHYTARVGIDFVGEGRHILVLPAVGSLVLLGNVLVGRLIMKADIRTAWILWSIVPLIQALLITALVFLMTLNR